MEDIFNVKLSRNALKHLKKVPGHVVVKMQAWIDDVGHRGLSEVRKIPGHHDEPLKGDRLGQRSIRLSHAYRAIYIVDREGIIKFLEILEVTKHAY